MPWNWHSRALERRDRPAATPDFRSSSGTNPPSRGARKVNKAASGWANRTTPLFFAPILPSTITTTSASTSTNPQNQAWGNLQDTPAPGFTPPPAPLPPLDGPSLALFSLELSLSLLFAPLSTSPASLHVVATLLRTPRYTPSPQPQPGPGDVSHSDRHRFSSLQPSSRRPVVHTISAIPSSAVSASASALVAAVPVPASFCCWHCIETALCIHPPLLGPELLCLVHSFSQQSARALAAWLRPSFSAFALYAARPLIYIKAHLEPNSSPSCRRDTLCARHPGKPQFCLIDAPLPPTAPQPSQSHSPRPQYPPLAPP